MCVVSVKKYRRTLFGTVGGGEILSYIFLSSIRVVLKKLEMERIRK